MAILNDLAKETSFSRFYLRWLAACWLPVIAVVVVWIGEVLLGDGIAALRLRFWLILQFWMIVGIGQWVCFRRYTSQAMCWAVRSVIGGCIATVVWVFLSAIFPGTPLDPLSLLGTYLSLSLGLPRLLMLLFPLISMGMGFAIALLQAPLLTENRGDRRMWIVGNSGSGAIIFAALGDRLDSFVIDRDTLVMGHDIADLAVAFSPLRATSLPISFLAFWVLYAAAIGLWLWTLRRRQIWRDNRMFETFE